jgi:hypothetical protein
MCKRVIVDVRVNVEVLGGYEGPEDGWDGLNRVVV